MFNRLWTFEKAHKARLEFLIFFCLTLSATVYYLWFFPIFREMPIATYSLAIGYAACILNYFLLLHPAAQIEKAICRDLKDQHHFLATDQDVTVRFLDNGLIDEIFYQDYSYRKHDEKGSGYQIYSNPTTGDPQIHFIRVGDWTEKSFAVVTQIVSKNEIIATVYDYRPQKALT